MISSREETPPATTRRQETAERNSFTRFISVPDIQPSRSTHVNKSSEAYSPSGVKTEMIWGCQWDAMMRFIGDRANETGNVSHDLRNSYATGGTDYPEDDYADISNNIYDLEGNVYEWTQEAYANGDRVMRGGNHDDDIEPNYRNYDYPTEALDLGSRITLYIET